MVCPVTVVHSAEMPESNIFRCLQTQRLGSSDPFCEEQGCWMRDQILPPRTFQQDPSSVPCSTWQRACPVERGAVSGAGSSGFEHCVCLQLTARGLQPAMLPLGRNGTNKV